MSFFRKTTHPRASESPEERARAADQFRTDIAALENDMAESTRALADLTKRAGVVEARAMTAIGAGDDRTARAFLLEYQAYAEKVAAIEADLKVLRAILDECHQFANTLSDSSAPRSQV